MYLINVDNFSTHVFYFLNCYYQIKEHLDNVTTILPLITVPLYEILSFNEILYSSVILRIYHYVYITWYIMWNKNVRKTTIKWLYYDMLTQWLSYEEIF